MNMLSKFFSKNKWWIAVIVLIAGLATFVYQKKDTIVSYVPTARTSFTAMLAQAFGTPEPPAPLPSKEVTLSFAGDIMLDRGVRQSVQNNFGGDYSTLFEKMSVLKNDDITFANLEGPASDQGDDLQNLYSFRMDPKVPGVIKNAGIDIVSFANNHVGDWGRAAFDDTRARLTEAGLPYVGSGDNKKSAETPRIIEKNGLKIGFIGFTDVGPEWLAATDSKSGVLLASDPNFDQIIKNAKNQVDVLIVSVHGGEEYNVGKHTTRQEDIAHRAIDAGATIFAGHHPHVMEDIEQYHGGLIAYSLGNFIFDQPFSKDTMQGLLLTVKLKDTKIDSYQKTIISLDSHFKPSVPEDMTPTITKVAPDTTTLSATAVQGAQEIAVPEPETPVKTELQNETPTETITPSLPIDTTQPTTKALVYAYGKKGVGKKIAITIDDGWDSRISEKAIGILRDKKVHATLFPVGIKVNVRPEIWREAVADGNELGNHTYSHLPITAETETQINNEIDGWQKEVDAALGYHYDTKWFRPPFMAGFTPQYHQNAKYKEIIGSHNLNVALWTIDTNSGVYVPDGLKVDPSVVVKYVTDNIKGGDILLLHFINADINALPDIIDGLRAKGYTFVTLSELTQ